MIVLKILKLMMLGMSVTFERELNMLSITLHDPANKESFNQQLPIDHITDEKISGCIDYMLSEMNK